MFSIKNIFLGICLAYVASAAAAEYQAGEHMVTVFLGEIALMLLVGRSLGELMQRIGQPSVMGQLISGILIGPSVLGALWPAAHELIFPNTPEQKKMIDAVSQLGILLLLLLTGMETDLALVKQKRRTAFFTSLLGISLPFAAGFTFGQFLPESMLPAQAQRQLTSLFLATALSVSSVKIVAVVLMEVDFFRRNIGQIILATAILDDTIAWILIAIIGGLALQGNVNLAGIASIVLGTLAFFGISLTIGRRIVAYLIRWTNDKLVIEMPVITVILLVMLGMALITASIGMHTVLGAFVAGIIIGQSPILTEHINAQLRGLIVALFMPVFFAVAGLSIDISVISNLYLMKLAVGLILIASLGKMLGCYFGGRLGGLTGRESLALGLGMNARGSTEVIVASVGLSMGVLSRDLYTLIVFMAVFTTLVMPPMLRWALARIPPSEEEKARLAQEELEAKEFVPNVERLLVTVEAGENGKLAARLAGLFAGARQITTTVLEISENNAEAQDGSEWAAEIVITSMEFAIGNLPVESGEGQESIASPSLTVRSSDKESSESILNEAEKGYDILFLGMEHAFGRNGAQSGHFSAAIEKIVDSYEGATAIALAGANRKSGQDSAALNILVPTIGTDYSRRAVEIAIVLAKACRGEVTALYVTPPQPVQVISPWWMKVMIRLRPKPLVTTGQPTVENVCSLGERYGVTVIPALITGETLEAAILTRVEQHDYDLVVLGVKARRGEGLLFGHNITAVLEHTPAPFLLVSS